MIATAPAAPPSGFARLLGWRRVLVALVAATVVGLILSPTFTAMSTARVISREMFVALAALLAFGLFEQWPARLPSWVGRWALQVIAVAIAVCLAVLFLYVVVNPDPPFWKDERRLNGFMSMTMSGLLFAPWIAVAALFRQRDFAARRQALAFALEKSELERKALDSRLRLLQAQVEPHFLFNTLANVRELVDSGSPQASTVLDSLIAYLRAAVPRLHETTTTMEQELQLARAYLELMHMRMPDRLQFTVHAEEAASGLRCPPTTVLTLVENAGRHGIDPSEDGGRIDVRVDVRNGRCHAQVCDTGVGLQQPGQGLGTGLATLLERLQLAFGGDAQLRLTELQPRSACAEVEFPAQGRPQ